VDRIGGRAPVPVDIRVVSAVNIEPREAVSRNLLRQDLLYRLNTIELRIPPLRERGGDARLLFDSFANRFGADYRMDPPRLSADDTEFLAAYPWPGNVRELRNAAERFVLSSALERPSLRALVTGGGPGPETAGRGRLRDLMEDYERRVIADALARHEGRVMDVMNELDLPRRTLNEKMSRLGLSRP
jgi:two-component system C4-dicarboxylate transport response regulator DctD